MRFEPNPRPRAGTRPGPWKPRAASGPGGPVPTRRRTALSTPNLGDLPQYRAAGFPSPRRSAVGGGRDSESAGRAAPVSGAASPRQTRAAEATKRLRSRGLLAADDGRGPSTDSGGEQAGLDKTRLSRPLGQPALYYCALPRLEPVCRTGRRGRMGEMGTTTTSPPASVQGARGQQARAPRRVHGSAPLLHRHRLPLRPSPR